MNDKNIEHKDIIGQPLLEGNYVVSSIRNSVYVCQISKITPKMLKVIPIASHRWFSKGGHLVHPSQVVLLSGTDALAYILKNSGPKDA